MKKRVLVADDDPSILDVIYIMLTEVGGYEVTTTANGESLLNMSGELPDLILLDLWMSGMDGTQICKALKANEETKSIPIIIFSANRDIKNIAESVGADGFVAKPFQMDELLEKIKNCIK